MKLDCSYEFAPKQPTCNTSYVQTVFGIGFETGRNVIARDVEIDYEPGKVVLFAGASGSGKSSLLKAAAAQVSGSSHVQDHSDDGRPLIDTLGRDVQAAAHMLSLCGLAEAMLMLRSPGELSDGQRYRYGLARCIARGTNTVIADEWCAKLDRTTACVISHNVRRIADKRGIGFLLATTHEDIIDDLQPDIVVWCRGGGVVEVENRRPFRGAISFCDEFEVVDATAADWAYFARWHYRGKGLGPVRRVNMLFRGAEPVGICVFGYGPLSSAMRNRVFGLEGKLTSARARRINRNFASVVRLVIDPRYRGAGLAAGFLRRVCELSPWPWIELISEMADLVPFCQAAGFTRMGLSRDKTLKSGDEPGSHYGKSNWTEATHRDYTRKARYSRPAYFLFDNRGKCCGRN